MLLYRRTSVLESSAQTLVNTVNCVGVMGKGIAKAFKDRDPDMFAAYKSICARGLLEPGKLWLWQGTSGWVLNFPTKVHWRNPSRLEWIEAGLQKFVAEYDRRGIKEISFPRLGCGNGGLEWADVKPLMERYLSNLDIPIYIHDHTVDIGIPEHLERVAEQVRQEGQPLSSFDGFMANLRRTIQLADSTFEDLSSRQPFTARLDDENLVIGESNRSWIVEPEDLRGVWVSLLSGLITRDKAGWSARESGDALISLLSVLPQVRPIEIQRSSSATAEVAAEFRPGTVRTAAAPSAGEQRQLSWA